jgi:methionyl aminopeptidase
LGRDAEQLRRDAAITIPVGKISPEVERLLQTTRESLFRAVEKMVGGNRLYDVSYAVQEFVEESGLHHLCANFAATASGRRCTRPASP